SPLLLPPTFGCTTVDRGCRPFDRGCGATRSSDQPTHAPTRTRATRSNRMGCARSAPVESRRDLREALEVVEHRRQILVRGIPEEVAHAEVGVRADVLHDLLGGA